MRRAILYLLVVAFVIAAFFLIRKSKTDMSPMQIAYEGFAQIGQGFNLQTGDFIYTSIYSINDTTSFATVIADTNDLELYKSKYYISRFIDDTLVFALDDNNVSYYGRYPIDKPYKRLIDLSNYELDITNFKVCHYNGAIGLFFIKENKLNFLNLKDSSEVVIVSPSDFGEQYSSIVSFDIRKDKGVACLKVPHLNNAFHYDYCTFDLRDKNCSFVYRGKETDYLAYTPIVRFYNDNEVYSSYYTNKEECIILRMNLQKSKVETINTLRNFKVINISLSQVRDEFYITMLDEIKRDSIISRNKNQLDYFGSIYSGINIFKYPLTKE